MRILHAGTEIFHMHGGGIRWRLNPHADHTYDYADTGLNKHPKAQDSSSSRLDSQAFGPGEPYDLEIEGGAGGVQQGAGEFLIHCHIAEHYVSGMWSFWRVFDTRQPDLVPLPDRAAPPTPVDSSGLIGKTIKGTTITAANLDEWVRPQLPAQGKRLDAQDASVWDYRKDGDAYVGEPEDTSSWIDYTDAQDRERADGHVVLPWKPGRKAVSKLLAGGHVLRVRVGADRKRLSGPLSAPVRLLGPRLRAAAVRRR
jgi:hypothetical protein